ncbi:hypothetical protein EKD04_017485 [Chloroflexales bacterium ZM16-3]|nr:hypothetical protein [Chloroflexales bacterium ZM16-3]
MATPETIRYCNNVYEEFTRLSDFIWKMNSQIHTLREIELRKLDLYYPDDAEMRQLRWNAEAKKLDYWFPITLNYSSVVQVFITLETSLRRTCNLLHKDRKLPLRPSEIKGGQIEKYLIFLGRLCGVSISNLTLLPQMDVLTKIRDCIVHTSGFIGDSRDEKDLRNAITSKRFLSQEDIQWRKEKGIQNKKEEGEIQVIKAELGDRLWIELDYSHTCCSYAKDFVDNIHKLVDLK